MQQCLSLISVEDLCYFDLQLIFLLLEGLVHTRAHLVLLACF